MKLFVPQLATGRNWVLQQALQRKTKIIVVLEWCSQRPDLNPIEMLWLDHEAAVHMSMPKKLNAVEKTRPKFLHNDVRE